MTIEEVKKEGIYSSLTAQQKTFVLEYLTNGCDKQKAAEKAYPNCKNYNSRMATAHDCLRNKKIALIVNRYFGYDPNISPVSKQELIGLISDRLRSPQTTTALFVGLTSTLIRLSNWTIADVPTEEKPVEDRAIPNFLNKYAKKWGAKVADTTLATDGQYEVQYDPKYEHTKWVVVETSPNIKIMGAFKTKDFADSFKKDLSSGSKVHSIEITPAMKKAVMQGQPIAKNTAPTDADLVGA